MARDLIIVGAGGDGRNLAEEKGTEWNLLGFLDDDPEKQGLVINGVPVLGPTSRVTQYKDSLFVVLVGNPKNMIVKKRLVAKLNQRAERYATVIHETAILSRYSKVGRGTVIRFMATVSANTLIGDHVSIQAKAHISHDCRVGPFSVIGLAAILPGRVVVQEGAYIGAGALIRNEVTVGEWSIVGMGSVVLEDVPPFHIVAGNPARVIGQMNPTDFES